VFSVHKDLCGISKVCDEALNTVCPPKKMTFLDVRQATFEVFMVWLYGNDLPDDSFAVKLLVDLFIFAHKIECVPLMDRVMDQLQNEDRYVGPGGDLSDDDLERIFYETPKRSAIRKYFAASCFLAVLDESINFAHLTTFLIKTPGAMEEYLSLQNYMISSKARPCDLFERRCGKCPGLQKCFFHSHRKFDIENEFDLYHCPIEIQCQCKEQTPKGQSTSTPISWIKK